MKLLKKIIIIVSILLICTLIVFFFLNSKKEEKKPDNTNITIVEEENDISYDIKEGELDISDYNAVNSAIKVYLQKLNLNSMSYYGVGDDDDMVSIYSEDEKKQKIIDTLSKKYVADNSITTKNLTDYVETVDKELLFAPVEIKRIVPEGISEDEYASADMRTYIAKGIVVTSEYEFNRELYLIVNIDYVNRTFSLQPTDEKYNELNGLTEIDEITKNENNQYSSGRVSTENIIKDYVNNYKKIVLTKPEIIYDYMDKEYREKRFGDVENFKQYVDKNREEIKAIDLTQYLVNNLDDYAEYVGKDQYGRFYIFEEKGVLDYKIKLDDYTLDYKDDEFVKSYNESDSQYKVANNINKWVKMINNRDYQSAYNVLDETFRETEFGSLEKFEEYMKRAFPEHYEVDYEQFSEESGGIYTQEIILKEIMIQDDDYEYQEGDEGDRVEKTIIMKLGDNTDFIMSFNITKADMARNQE